MSPLDQHRKISDVLSEWEAEAKHLLAGNRDFREAEVEDQQRILTLIDLVRKKDALTREALRELWEIRKTNDIKNELFILAGSQCAILERSLALTEEIK